MFNRNEKACLIYLEVGLENLGSECTILVVEENHGHLIGIVSGIQKLFKYMIVIQTFPYHTHISVSKAFD